MQKNCTTANYFLYLRLNFQAFFVFLMMYNLLFVPDPKKSGTFLLFHVKKVAKNFCFP